MVVAAAAAAAAGVAVDVAVAVAVAVAVVIRTTAQLTLFKLVRRPPQTRLRKGPMEAVARVGYISFPSTDFLQSG